MSARKLLFSRNLIKGSIAELVFERMFAETGNFLIVPFGYEKTVNILTQVKKDKEAFEMVRNMPDYVLIDKKTEETYIVEVKYRSKKNYKEIQETAKHIKEIGWKKVWYFLATPEGFYFVLCSDLMEDPRIINEKKLPTSKVSAQKQAEYLKILKEFENQ